MKTYEELQVEISGLEAELDSLWDDFERLQKDSADKTDKIQLLRKRIRELRG
jgi:predicted  nucleic acid-binding Zn-ribbon protein